MSLLGTKRHCAGGLISCPELRELRTSIECGWNPGARLSLTRSRLLRSPLMTLLLRSSTFHEMRAQHPIDGVVPGWQYRLIHLGARVEQQACALVVPLGRKLPRVECPMDQPAHRGPIVLAVPRVDRRTVPQDLFHHDRVAVIRRPM